MGLYGRHTGKKELPNLIYFTIAFLCNAGLFLALLEDRYRFWTTVSVTAAVYFLSLACGGLLSHAIKDIQLANQLSCLLNVLLLFLSSLFLSTNNFMQKLYLALLAMCNFAFLSFFCELLLGIMPFSTTGAFAGIFSVLLYLLFTALLCLCLYRPYHHFSDRGVSGFITGIFLISIFGYFLCLGSFDFLFRTNIFAARLLYSAILFAFRSLFHAAKFRETSAEEAARRRILEMESGDFADMLAGIKEVKNAGKNGEYALDTVKVMVLDGVSDRVPGYVDSIKASIAQSPMLRDYNENPYINAVIATKAALCSQSGIMFESSAFIGETPLKTGEICIIANELLTKAWLTASHFEGERKIHFTLFTAPEGLCFEAVYSAYPEPNEKFTLRGKNVAQVISWFLEDRTEDQDQTGLENTAEIVNRYSGKISISDSPEGKIVKVLVRY